MKHFLMFLGIWFGISAALADEIVMHADFTVKPEPGGGFDLIRWKSFGATRVTSEGLITEPSRETGWSSLSTPIGLDKLPSPAEGSIIVSWSFITMAADGTQPKGCASQAMLGQAFIVDLEQGLHPRLNEKSFSYTALPLGERCQMAVELNSRHILSWKINGIEQLKEPQPFFRLGGSGTSFSFRDFSAHNIRTIWKEFSIVRTDHREKVPIAEMWDFISEPEPDKISDFLLTTASSMHKIFRETAAFSGKVSTEAYITAAGRESESFQAVIIPLHKHLKNFKIAISDMKRDGDGKVFSSANITWNPIGYVRSRTCSSSIKRANWLWPDVLLPQEELAIDPDFIQPIWFTVTVPENFSPGTYRGIVTFAADNSAQRVLRLRLDIRNYSLPLRGKFRTAFGLNPGALELWWFPKETRELTGMQKKVNLYLLLSARQTQKLIPREQWLDIYDMLLDHRVNPLNLYSPPVNGVTRPLPDQEDFQYCFERGLNAVCLGGIEWLPQDRNAYFADYAKYLKSWEKIALSPEGKEITWVIHCFDESSSKGEAAQETKDNEFVAVRHFLDREFPWIDLESPNPYMSKHEKNIDIWVPHNSQLAEAPEQYARVIKDHPGKVWGYVSNVSWKPLNAFFLDYPGTDPRVLPWQFFQQGLNGFLYWNLLDITGQPNWEDGPRWPEVPWQSVGSGCNGCGVLVYPWRNQQLLSSIRFENLRDGIEDYEAMNMLQELLDKELDKGRDVTAVKEEFTALQSQVAGNWFCNATDAPEIVSSARHRIDELIEKLLKP